MMEKRKKRPEPVAAIFQTWDFVPSWEKPLPWPTAYRFYPVGLVKANSPREVMRLVSEQPCCEKVKLSSECRSLSIYDIVVLGTGHGPVWQLTSRGWIRLEERLDRDVRRRTCWPDYFLFEERLAQHLDF